MLIMLAFDLIQSDRREIIYALKRTSEFNPCQISLKLNERPQYLILMNEDKWLLNLDQNSWRLFASEYFWCFDANRNIDLWKYEFNHHYFNFLNDNIIHTTLTHYTLEWDTSGNLSMCENFHSGTPSLCHQPALLPSIASSVREDRIGLILPHLLILTEHPFLLTLPSSSAHLFTNMLPFF